MSLARKPLDSPQDPGYPDAQEYASSRRAFLWLLGAAVAAVAGAAGAYELKGKTPPLRKALPPAKPLARACGE
jgi:hypothetical protein